LFIYVFYKERDLEDFDDGITYIADSNNSRIEDTRQEYICSVTVAKGIY